jgi:hypothetical protein
MELVDLEISRHAWGDIPCGCGQSADHVGDLLRRASQGAVEDLAAATDYHVWSSPVLYSPAPAATEVALAALADDLSQQACEQFLELLSVLVGGEGTDHEAAAAGLDLPELCGQIASRGMRLLYRELSLARSFGAVRLAFELLVALEPDRGRLQQAQVALAEALPWDLRAGLLNDPFQNAAEDEC